MNNPDKYPVIGAEPDCSRPFTRREFAKGASLAALGMSMMPDLLLGQSSREAGYRVGTKSRPPAKRMFVFRLEDLPVNVEDLRLTLACLQGLVNRSQPRLYLVQDRYDELWLNWLQERGDIQDVEYLDISRLFDMFQGVATCMFVTDPAIPASVNVATMLAGVHNGLVVTPGMSEMFRLPQGSPPNSYRTGADLRAMYWKKDIDAYRWCFDKVGGQLTKRAVAYLDPESHANRDYFVEFNVPIVWISNPERQNSPRESFEEERAFVRDIFMKWPPNIPCMGWPRDGVSIGEWGGRAARKPVREVRGVYR